jgi:hypothetical protein
MKIDGGCHCGAITYEAEVDPDKTSICHCTDCQQLTGTAFGVTVPGAGKRLRGSPRACRRLYQDGLHGQQAGPGLLRRVRLSPLRHFGGRWAQDLRHQGRHLASARGTGAERQSWHRSALHWLPEFEGMTTVEEQ